MPVNPILKSIQPITNAPGIYQMLGASGQVLYVGKAKNLRRRVTSYFRTHSDSPKTAALMKQVHDVHFIITQTENEALLLESSLIKKLKPRYNVVFRDDKSYPYLFLSDQHPFPRLSYHRGAKHTKGTYFGPYPSSKAVHDTLSLLQKLFQVRQCRDSFFSHRSRPCLQYQIKRCTAPCVGYIDQKAYQEDIKHVKLFLTGKSAEVIHGLSQKMQTASEQRHYELAASLRDKIISLQKIRSQPHMTHPTQEDIDVIAVTHRKPIACVIVLYIRSGRLIGDKHYLVNLAPEMQAEEILSDFLPQYYLNPVRRHDLPKTVWVNLKLPDRLWIAQAISDTVKRPFRIIDTLRGKDKEWIHLAEKNAHYHLESQVTQLNHINQRLAALQKALNLSALPQWIECFDVSHTSGTHTVASCVVFSENGPEKKYYRRFNLSGITPGDDYTALKQALERHYCQIKKQEKPIPDLIIIDGGKGQLHIAEKALEESQLEGVTLLGVSKGPQRKAGEEQLHLVGQKQPLRLPADSPALHLIQVIRDSAHHFAITGHRRQRLKAQQTSPLEGIPGIGAKRRRALLHTLGGLKAVESASVSLLATVPGISRSLAQTIYDALHED